MAPKKQSPKSKDQPNKRLHLAILKQMIALVAGGFGLVAALAWNNVVQELVNNYIKPFLPNGSGLISLLIYALLVTSLAVILTVYLSRLIEKIDP